MLRNFMAVVLSFLFFPLMVTSLRAVVIEISPYTAFAKPSYTHSNSNELSIIPGIEIQLGISGGFYGALGAYYTSVNMGKAPDIISDFSNVPGGPLDDVMINLNLIPVYFALNYEKAINRDNYIGGYIRYGVAAGSQIYYTDYSMAQVSVDGQEVWEYSDTEASLIPNHLLGVGLSYGYRSIQLTAFYDVINMKNKLVTSGGVQSKTNYLSLVGLRISYLLSYNSRG